MKELIRDLSQTFGPSGYETKVRDLIREIVTPYADEIKSDVMGNLIVRKGSLKENGKRIMIAAHMDEIGLMVSHIDEKGFVYVAAIGGVHPLNCVSGRVMFENGTEGVIYYEQSKADKCPAIGQLFIDVGASSRDDCPVHVGDICVFLRPFLDLGHRWVSKALDNRIGCAIAIETLKSIQDSPNELNFVFTVQEEVGCRGAATSAYTVDPDMGIAVDVTIASDVPHGIEGNLVLGSGPCIKGRDSSLVAHPAVIAAMKEAALRAGIKTQIDVLRFAGTDAGNISLTRSGVPSGALSVSCRYVHSPSEMVDVGDCTDSVKLLAELLSHEVVL